MATVYKLVEESESGFLQSLYAMGPYQTFYTLGEPVRGSNLFVFLDKKKAKEYRGTTPWQIWECETTTDPRPAPPYIPNSTFTNVSGWHSFFGKRTDELIAEFWSDPYLNRTLSMGATPEGTYLVDDVKLVKRVY